MSGGRLSGGRLSGGRLSGGRLSGGLMSVHRVRLVQVVREHLSKGVKQLFPDITTTDDYKKLEMRKHNMGKDQVSINEGRTVCISWLLMKAWNSCFQTYQWRMTIKSLKWGSTTWGKTKCQSTKAELCASLLISRCGATPCGEKVWNPSVSVWMSYWELIRCSKTRTTRLRTQSLQLGGNRSSKLFPLWVPKQEEGWKEGRFGSVSNYDPRGMHVVQGRPWRIVTIHVDYI